ncbi:MAG: NAD(P)/FAD-dependent oxidoreductase [Desulfobulbaceae bacterium]|uniref:NAD(P)/FAD-dependent oxidoreductase n=1 Tax=Candidatus Desulfobia pelagia TaxID=2841692 RepID=A0A8J6NIC4_9BACT|nr:NAD(P)/FAD-dependent oxidoreductase [Candidatus Desulfobia pelagia]
MLKSGEKGAVLQKDGESYAIVPHFPLGMITADNLRTLADVADKYKLPAIKITSASRIAMVGFKEDQIDDAWKDLGITPGAAVGMCIRSIQACPGTALCRLGKQDSLGLGMEIDSRYHGYELPNKLKMGVSGCVNNCAETPVKDIGFVGKPKGWTVVVGGNAGARPQLAQDLISDLTTEEALALADKIVNYFQKEAKKSERMGRFIDRIGFDAFKDAVLS